MGNCIVISECASVINVIRTKGIQSTEALRYLRQITCGFERNNPKVCCERDSGATGDRNVFDRQGDRNKQSSKEMGNDPNKPFQNPLSLLPSKCGEDIPNRIIGGEATELGEFPWMAVLEYQNRKYL